MSRPRLPADEWSLRREALLRAAAALIADGGAAAVTMESVARRAGVSKGAVQYAFGTKDEMLSALARWVVDRYVAESVGRPETLDRDVIGIIDDITEALASDHDRLLAMLALAQIGQSEEWARRPLADYQENTAGRLGPALGRALRRQGRMLDATPEDDALLAQAIRAMILGMYSHWAVSPFGRTRADVAREVREMVARLLDLPRDSVMRELGWSSETGERPDQDEGPLEGEAAA